MSSSHAALIVDADPKGARIPGLRIPRRGLANHSLPDARDRVPAGQGLGREIVVIASRTEHEKAHTLIRQIRSKEAFRTLPLLVLGPEELRKPLKERRRRPAAAASLRPRRPDRKSVAGGGRRDPPHRSPGRTELLATHHGRTTLSLVRTMNGLARSGQLQLERKGRHGEILFHEGELTAAQVGQLQGMAAVQHVLIWNDGALQLHLRPVVRRGQLHQTAQEFLEELDRFQRDFTHADQGHRSARDRLHQERGGLLLNSTTSYRPRSRRWFACATASERFRISSMKVRSAFSTPCGF
jgi:hypothetical protein